MSKKTLSSSKIIYLYENEKDEIKKQYNIDPINLYSYDKPYDDKPYDDKPSKKKSSSLLNKKGGTTDILSLYSTTHIGTSRTEAGKILDFINHFYNLLNTTLSSKIKLGFIINLRIGSQRYFIEFSVKQNEKLIISVNRSRHFTTELIHVSCFPTSFIHITFINYPDTYRLYYKIIPKKNNRFNDVLNFVLKSKTDIFDGKDTIPISFWNRNWNLILRGSLFERFKDDLETLYIVINHINSS